MTTDGGGWAQIQYLTTDTEGYNRGYASVFDSDTLGTEGSGSFKIDSADMIQVATHLRYSIPSSHISNSRTDTWGIDFSCEITSSVREKAMNPGSSNQVPADIQCTNIATGAVSAKAIKFNYQHWTGCWYGPRMWICDEATAPSYHGNYDTECIVTWKCDDTSSGVYNANGVSSNSAAFWLKFDS